MELWWSGKLPEPPWTHLGSSWIISGSFKTVHKLVIFDMIFAISKRCLNPTLQTSKVIEIQNGDQIQIRLVELVMGKIVKPKINVWDFIKLKMCILIITLTTGQLYKATNQFKISSIQKVSNGSSTKIMG